MAYDGAGEGEGKRESVSDVGRTDHMTFSCVWCQSDTSVHNIYFHQKRRLHHHCPHIFFFHPQGVSARSTEVTSQASQVRHVLRIMKEALPYAESFEKRACV